MAVKKVATVLKNGGLAVIPTDTILGVVAQARDKKAVARLYRLRQRMPKKPCIILIRDSAQLGSFGVHPTERERRFLKSVWPGKVSIVFPAEKKWAYLHRGTHTLAFRVPRSALLCALLKKTGPLLAPSANPEGLPPAKTAPQARAYFGNKVDGYSGRSASQEPSTIVSLVNGLRILRRGAVSTEKILRSWRQAG
ncbi:MAG: L-threonylcarbamoyladenylate synthase [bacterium]|nr:L-threonylcarbamoyladenylate synthase [bacterium]